MVFQVLICSAVSLSSRAAVLFKDGFESGNISHTEGGMSWSSPEKLTVVSEKAKSGTYSAKFHFPGSSDLAADSWSELRFAFPQMRTEIWIKYDLYIPTNYYHRKASGASNNKGLIMLWGGDYGAMSTQSAISLWPSLSSSKPGASMMCADVKTNGGESTHYCEQANLMNNNVTAATETVAIDPSVDGGKWRTFVFHIKLSDVGKNNGVYQVWKDSALLWSTSNVPNYANASSNNGFNNGYIFGWANSGFNEDTDLYLDNVAFGEVPADISFTVPVAPVATVR
jgi:hypothetical protein